jgi:hypothetical protein
MLALIATLAIALGAHSGTATVQRQVAPGFPARGIFVPGKSLGGIQLGDSQATVEASWGTNHQSCDPALCGPSTWLYIANLKEGPRGVGVTFDPNGNVIALFTLGSPFGWRTAEGVRMGDLFENVVQVYGNTGFRMCTGYGAMTMRTPAATTSVYVYGEVIYGFALTAPSAPVCT